MASGGIRSAAVGVIVALVAMLYCWSGAMSQTSGCTNVLISMAPCLNYVTGSSSTPTSSCCSQLATVVRSQPQCLCLVINGAAGSSLGVNINRTLALALPAACNVQTPPVSKCDDINQSGAMSPAGSPKGSPVGGSKEQPVESGSSMIGPNNKSLLLQLIVVAFLMASGLPAFGCVG